MCDGDPDVPGEPPSRDGMTRRAALNAGVAALLLAVGAMPLASVAAKRAGHGRRVRQRRRDRSRNKTTETSVSIPGQDGGAGDDGTVAGAG